MNIQGINNYKIIFSKKYKHKKYIENKHFMVGAALTELQLNISLKSRKEIQDLIEILQMCEPCFEK